MTGRTTRRVLLVLVFAVIAISASTPLQNTTQDLGRDASNNVVGDTDGGILEIQETTQVFYGVSNQPLATIRNPTTTTQSVTIELSASGVGWLFSTTERTQTITLTPNESKTFTVTVPESYDAPRNTSYTITSTFQNEPTTFQKQLTTTIDHDWDAIVDSDGSGDYTTIQAAVNDANPGDKINVKSGQYYESVTIPKPLFVAGDAISSPQVTATGGSAFALQSSNVVIREFDIDAAGVQDGVKADVGDLTGLQFLDLTVHGSTRACAYVDGTIVRRISNSTFTNCGEAGVYGAGSILKTLSHTTITESNDGIRWELKSNNKLESCTGPPPQRPASCDTGSEPSTRIIESIYDNKITHNQRNVYLETWANTVFQYNRLDSPNSGAALVLDGAGKEDGTIRVTSNYWGASSGPSGGVTDPETGAIANGNGASIANIDKGSVRFDPWLTVQPSNVGDLD